MVKITISEKGGPDREFLFDEGDVSFGRVQGNSIVLPKANVSKRHAVLSISDQGILLVDQKSTNGTYVNGRRITGPKEIGLEDRIYIGDFTIRLAEAGADESAVAVEQPVLPEETDYMPTLSMPAVTAPNLRIPVGNAAEPVPVPPPLPPEENSAEAPLDFDVEVYTDEPSDMAPPPPPVPEVPPVRAAVVAPPLPEEPAFDESPVVPIDIEPRKAHSQMSELSRRTSNLVPASERGDIERYLAAQRIVAARCESAGLLSIDPNRSEFTDSEWSHLSEKVMRLVEVLRREKTLPADVDPYVLTQDTLFEFTGLGPLEELIGDESIRVIMVDSLDRVFVARDGRAERVPHGFVSEETLAAIVARLMALCGTSVTDGPVQEGRLPDGTYMLLLRPPLVAEGTVLVFDRPVKTTLDPADLVAAGTMDDACLELLRSGLAARRNLLVCGPQGAGRMRFLNAILKLIVPEDRIVVVEGRRELALTQQNVVSLSRDGLIASGAVGLGALGRLYADVVVLADVDGPGAETLVRLAVAGQTGLVSSMVATSAESGLRRFELLVSLADPRLSPEVVHQAVRQALDIVVVLGADEDGRPRVIEIAEMDRDRGILKFLETGG